MIYKKKEVITHQNLGKTISLKIFKFKRISKNGKHSFEDFVFIVLRVKIRFRLGLGLLSQ